MLVRPSRALAYVLVAIVALTVYTPQDASAHLLRKAMKQRRHVEDRARSQSGTRYTYGGESPRRGFDCSGFTSWVYEKHGAQLSRTSIDQFKQAKQKGNIRIWKRSKLKTGDLVFFKTTSAKIGHVGVYVGKGRFVSSTSSSGVRVDSVYDPYYWGRRWVGATRLRATRA